jgi:hypothetical protein
MNAVDFCPKYVMMGKANAGTGSGIMSGPENKLKSSIAESLVAGGGLTDGEGEAIAAVIESELARLLPEPPAWSAEHIARAIQAALRIAGKLAEPQRCDDE